MKATITSASKENLFGRSDRTPGQNLMRAVTHSDQPIGIPPYNYPAMMQIFSQALEPDEADLLCRGYGLNRTRQSQKEIAADLNLDPNDVSVRAHRAVKKLQVSPFKTQLRKLVPTLEELFDSASKAHEGWDAVAAATRRADSLSRRCQQAENENARLRSSNAELQKAAITANGDLAATQSQLKAARDQIETLTSEVIREKARAEAIKEAFDQTLEDARTTFAARLANIGARTITLEALHLSKSTMERLQRAGVHDLDTLCRTPAAALIRLGVGRDKLPEIERKLSEHNLALRAS